VKIENKIKMYGCDLNY